MTWFSIRDYFISELFYSIQYILVDPREVFPGLNIACALVFVDPAGTSCVLDVTISLFISLGFMRPADLAGSFSGRLECRH